MKRGLLSVCVRPSYLPSFAMPRHGVHFNLKGRRSSLLSGYFMQPTRLSNSKSFKAQVIQECAQPGASVASITLSQSLNANLVHKWIRLHAQNSPALPPAFIPTAMLLAGTNSHHAASNICVGIQQPRCTVKVNWPTEHAAACATFLRYLLQRFHLARYRADGYARPEG
jgi:transposase